MILRFLALDGVDSYSPVRARLNKIEPLGKVRTPEGKWIVDPSGEAARVVLSGDDLHEDKQFLRKEVLRGHILVADEETALLLEVPWNPESVERMPAQLVETLEGGVVGVANLPPGASLAETTAALLALPPNDPSAVLAPRPDGDATPLADALAKHADTLPPPPPESPAVTPAKAPARRKES